MIDISKSFTSLSGYPQFIDNTKIISQRGDRLELHEINRYEEADKEIKTIPLSTINIKIQNTQFKSMAIIKIIAYFFFLFRFSENLRAW